MEFPKILLVDDDAEDRAIIEDALKTLHPDNVIGCAENGEAALMYLRPLVAAEKLPSLIVLDLNMPKMNGTQTLKHLKTDEHLKEIPVIIYSTSINPAEKEKCMLLGAHSYITKPVSYQESIETARMLLQFCELNSLVA